MTVFQQPITIPLRDFAVPAPLTGSIEPHSGYGHSAAEGREIHLRVQRKRAKSDPLYQAEVPVKLIFRREEFEFRIDGRMDGIFRHDPPRIEEIKSTFSIGDLAHRLAAHPLAHPYCLQLLTYGYCHWRDHQVVPELTFHLVSSRTGKSEDLVLPFDLAAYEEWLERRLDELVKEARLAAKRAARRKKLAAAFAFPFSFPRPGQVELMETIERGMAARRPMMIQAPTGLGKTMGVLYPVLKDTLGRGERTIYVTPKNSQHSVAEDAVTRLKDAGLRVRSLSVTARSKICPKGEPLCSPDYCEYARDYYARVRDETLRETLSRKRKLKARVFRELGERYRVCPFELQFDCSHDADVIICDYNYVFAPRSGLGRVGGIEIDQTGKPALVVDEAHNLPARGMDYYSPSLSCTILEKMREELHTLSPRLRRDGEELLDDCIRAVASCGNHHAAPLRIEPPVEPFLEQDARLRAFLTRYLDSDSDITPHDVVLRLCSYWSQFVEVLEYVAEPGREEFFTTWHPHPAGGTVRITCCDAGPLLRETYADFQHVVCFSATLKPFDYYARLSGLDPLAVLTAEFASPFPRERRKLLIVPQVSTRYADRERNYGKIADAVRRIASLRQGNYFVFLPSFEFLERVTALFVPPAGFAVVSQERGMTNAQVEGILEILRAGETPTLVFAVQGGSFSEGVDYAGEMVIGAFVIGPPLPGYDLEREQMRQYYQRRYGAGFEYAYTIPAMAKAVQAAGRVIRSEEDRGLIVLMDNRFTEGSFTRSMPADWFEEDVTELVSDAILRDVEDFWASPSSLSGRGSG